MSLRQALVGFMLVGCTLSTLFTIQAEAGDGLLDPELIALYKGSNVNPFDVTATNNLAMKFTRQGRYDHALRLLQRAIKLAPMRNDIERNLTQLSVLVSQIEGLDVKTSLSYSKSFRANETPFVPEPWGVEANVGDVISPTADTHKPEIVLSANPFDSQSLVTTARLKLDRGDNRGALNDLLRAKRLSPWMTELDEQIEHLESHFSVQDSERLDYSSVSLTSNNDDDLQNVEPPPAWPTSIGVLAN